MSENIPRKFVTELERRHYGSVPVLEKYGDSVGAAGVQRGVAAHHLVLRENVGVSFSGPGRAGQDSIYV
eukprot:CAMPEP_0194280356 /NCGR_PEP_ID=MMETSP0169-20130528/16914_1 /TAXON_ID=218684 /ORGANISM="Corethron pennatum, Strain L29A3" /LENGTH=68 /DNA_ID=CAMNT_0039025043 /DNA_START=426 /DNA_END=632 /DNA_ORIENTATION=-